MKAIAVLAMLLISVYFPTTTTENTDESIVKIIGDGSTPLTLDFIVYANGEYFCAARLWKVRR